MRVILLAARLASGKEDRSRLVRDRRLDTPSTRAVAELVEIPNSWLLQLGHDG